MECPTCGKNMKLIEGRDGTKYYKCLYCGRIVNEIPNITG
jgi:DNA-directed RNA polymerase subunit RPC12/RpoP